MCVHVSVVFVWVMCSRGRPFPAVVPPALQTWWDVAGLQSPRYLVGLRPNSVHTVWCSGSLDTVNIISHSADAFIQRDWQVRNFCSYYVLGIFTTNQDFKMKLCIFVFWQNDLIFTSSTKKHTTWIRQVVLFLESGELVYFFQGKVKIIIGFYVNSFIAIFFCCKLCNLSSIQCTQVS